jgi:broad specificity phosphatase PhoE
MPFYFVRHGETDWNVEGRLQGQRDVSLNATGRLQAVACGHILRNLLAREGRGPADFEFVSSPLSRARETMELMRAALGVEATGYQLDPRLMELSFGNWEGSTIAEIRARDPAGIAAREHDKWRFVPPRGESYQMLSVRIDAWRETLGEHTIAVAHGGGARTLIALAGIAPPETAPAMNIEQGVVYEFSARRMKIHR